MKTIWKQKIPITDRFVLKLNKNSRILCVQTQNSIPCIWFTTDDEELEKETRIFRVYGTGHPMQENACNVYIGTFMVRAERLVFHLFEEAKNPIGQGY